jgi:glycosyltransferase involved in cell wall biosynthesis
MKIAIITSGFLPVVDGVTVSGLYRLQKLSQWGHQVVLFCPDYSCLAHLYPNWKDYTGEILPGVRVINLESTPFVDLDFERNVSRKSYNTLLAELEKFKPDIIHVDEPERLFVGFWRITGKDYAKKANIPCVGFFRTNFLEYIDDYAAFPIGGMTISLPKWTISFVKFLFKKFICWVYNAYDATLIHNLVIHKKLIEIGIKNTIYENLNGFDPGKFNPSLREAGFFEKNYGLSECERKVKLVFLGRLTPDKGWNFTISKAFPTAIKQVNPEDIALFIIGDGPMREEIDRTLKQILPHVYLLGRVAPQNIPALLANCDIYVTTSEKENRALTIIEALASRLPILAPHAGGIPQDVRDSWNGFLFIPQDANDFAQKLKTLVENPALRQDMGSKGRQYIEEFNSWDKTVQNLLAIWQKQIERKSAAKNLLK